MKFKVENPPDLIKHSELDISQVIPTKLVTLASRTMHVSIVTRAKPKQLEHVLKVLLCRRHLHKLLVNSRIVGL